MTDDSGSARTFFVYMEAVMASDLSPTQRWILTVQAKYANASGGRLTNSFPSQETLARETGLSESTIKRDRKKLEALGWLDKTHSGRGGSSKLANAYDLYIPDELRARLDAEDEAKAKGHGDALQRVMVTEQRVMVTPSKGHGDPTSTPSSTPLSADITAPSYIAAEEDQRKDKDGPRAIPSAPGHRPVSFWVGYSKARPDGYFKKIDGATVEPRGAHTRVILSAEEANDLFGYDYPDILKALLDRAHRLGLQEPRRSAPGILSREERERRYGLATR